MKLIICLFSIVFIGSVCPSQLSMNNNEFAVEMLQLISREHENVFFSPISITTALKMLLPGARNTTKEELKTVLGIAENDTLKNTHTEMKQLIEDINQDDENGTIFKMVNRILVQSTTQLKKNYINTVKTNYKAMINRLNITSDNYRNITQEINDWVYNQTNGKIQKIFNEPISPDTEMVLLNVVYFLGKWKFPFNPNFTSREDFHNLGSNISTPVETMVKQDRYKYVKLRELKSRMIQIPYVDEFNMYILLPDRTNGLDDVVQLLSGENLQEAINQFKSNQSSTNATQGLNDNEVLLYLPKFHLEEEYDLKDILNDMEVKTLFTDEADLSGINGKRNLKVSQAIHKSFIQVDEKGSEAAGLSAIRITPLSYIEPDVFRINKPFIFFIHNQQHDVITFVGQVRNLVGDELLSLAFI